MVSRVSLSLAIVLVVAACHHSRRAANIAPTQTAPSVDPVLSPTASLSTTLTGLAVKAGSALRVDGGADSVQGVAAVDRKFSILVPLQPNRAHTLLVTELFAGGGQSVGVPVDVIQDLQAPQVWIDFPTNAMTLSSATTHVQGRVGDALSGAFGFQVLVNGVPAQTSVGNGGQGTFDLPGLTIGSSAPTEIVVQAQDAAGNQTEQKIAVSYQAPVGNTITLIDGGGQSGTAGSYLANPLRVRVTRPDGSPFAGKVVTGLITAGDGLLSLDGQSPGINPLQALTDSAGEVRCYWALGNTAGLGNHRLQLTSTDVAGQVYASASAVARAPSQINVDRGSAQATAPNAEAPQPLRAWVSDTANGVANVPVTFTVLSGGGAVFAPGQAQGSTITVDTDASGHAQARLRAGPSGDQSVVVAASFNGNPGAAAYFNVRVRAGNQPATSFDGQVLDNAWQPLAGATCTLTIGPSAPLTAVTDATGSFRFDGLPDTGLGRLLVDGRTVTQVGGRPINPALVQYPTLAYDTSLAPNTANALPSPIVLPFASRANEVAYDGTTSVVLTMPDVAGTQIVVPAGTLILPDGTQPTPTAPLQTPLQLSWNQVHSNTLPVPLPDGAEPALAWIVEPAGLTFSPPASVVVPNTSAMAPGGVGALHSRATDGAQFATTGAMRVAADGATLQSALGSGLVASGWGAVSTHYARTGQVVGTDSQLDASWWLSAGGQSAFADGGGSFTITNVPAADSFGAAGPGSAPDGLSDCSLRVLGTGLVNGQRQFISSAPFQMAGLTHTVGLLLVTPTPPQVPVGIRVGLDSSILTEPGVTAQAYVAAVFADGSVVDVTGRAGWTTYVTSSPQVATVDQDGKITAVGTGSAYITARNSGTNSVAQVTVLPATDPLSTVIGFVELRDGTRVPGATVTIDGVANTATTLADGSYVIVGVPTTGIPSYVVRARGTLGSSRLVGAKLGLSPVLGGLTDAGILAVDVALGYGPVILAGMDPEDHGNLPGEPGWQLIQDTVRNVVSLSQRSSTPSRVLQLGAMSKIASIVQSAITPLGYTLTHVAGNAIQTVDFMQYDALYMPTTDSDSNGGLSALELGYINQRAADVAAFVNAGGGLVAFAQTLPNSYQWMPVSGLQSARPSTSNITLTPKGQLILSASTSLVTPTHTAFVGPSGFFGLEVLVVEAAGRQQPLLLGGLLFVP